jgi:hypothetical protein
MRSTSATALVNAASTRPRMLSNKGGSYPDAAGQLNCNDEVEQQDAGLSEGHEPLGPIGAAALISLSSDWMHDSDARQKVIGLGRNR